MSLKLIFLFITLKSVLIASQSISCIYRQLQPEYPYTCDLTLDNPNGSDNFDSIPGSHLDGRSNADVTALNGFNQNSRNIPAVICRQFPNLVDLYISGSNIEFINETAFTGCRNLEHLMLTANEITDIPNNTFRNNENLEFLYLSYNSITSLNDDSFTGTKLIYLDLGVNLISTFNGQSFLPLAPSLQFLLLVANNFTSLPSSAFSTLTNLLYLDLTGIKFTSIATDAFNGLSNLETIYLSDCGLTEINRSWFSSLQSLDEFHFEYNSVTDLPDGLFAQLVRLQSLYLGSNSIQQVSALAFGQNLASLEVLYINNNPITSIDRNLFNQAGHLNSLGMYGTNCHDSNIYYIQTNRQQTSNMLAKCFANFGDEFVICSYGTGSNDDYSCILSVINPFGTDFETIDGEHLAGRGNSDVVTVFAESKSTRVVPAAVCRQFTNLRHLTVSASFVEEIVDEFSMCRNLESLSLVRNDLRRLDENIFASAVNLAELNLNSNRINELSTNTFAQTVLRHLDLSNNRLFNFMNEWTRPIEQTLEVLDLSANQIQQIASNTFANLANLKILHLNQNFLDRIDDDAFAALTSLENLEIFGCGLSQLNPNWFQNLSNLRHLSVANNRLSQLQSNIFDSLSSLTELYFYNNRIVSINADTFGSSLPSLEILYGSNNLINSFDPQILETATSLSSLLFVNNICIQENLFGVRDDLELTSQALANCTANFQLEPTLSCVYDRMITGRIYWCQLTAVNPLGSDNFESVDGQHLPGANDDAVMYVTAERQNSRTIPSVLCRQFTSMQVLDLIFNDIDEITENSFSNCDFLREIFLMGSRIRQIPERAFSGTPNLQVLFLDANGIEFVGQTAFAGTQIHTLDLSFNEIHDFNPSTYATIGRTLRILRLAENRLESLPAEAFEGLPNLIELELNHNHFFTLPSDVFNSAANLQILQIANCGLERLQPEIFSRLTDLVDLELGLNDLRFLPDGIFDLPRLQTLGIVQNSFTVLDSAAFGRSLGSLFSIDAFGSRIDAVDPEMITSTSNLRSLNLGFTGCSDDNFIDIPQRRDEVLARLQACVGNFNDISIECEFVENGETAYDCLLALNNTVDRLRFDRVSGQHLEGRNDSFVSHVRAESQNSRTIPSIICQQFPNTEAINFISSNVEVVTAESFRNCENLYSINLAGNRIVEIPSNAFSASSNLAVLILASNQLRSLSAQIFEGTSLYFLDIEDNFFRQFNPDWFSPQVALGLRYLILRSNEIQRLPAVAFSRFANLFDLELNGNENIFIPSNAFNGLSRLFDLQLAECGLSELNPHWFKHLTALNRLEVDQNGISSLPHRTFDLPALETLGIAFNDIRVIHSRVFGSSLTSIVSIDARDNQIDGIDRRVVVGNDRINILSVSGNSCVDHDFDNVQEDMDVVVEDLAACFDNFDNMV